MRAQLAIIRQEILRSPVFVAGRPDSADKAGKEAVRLAKLSETVLIIVRDLKSSESLIRLREKALWNIPRDRRFSAEQSLKQLGKNIGELRQEAEALAELLRDLLDRNGLLNPIQKTKAILDLLKDLEKTVGHEAQAQLAQIHQPVQDTIGPSTPGGPPLTLSGIAPLLVFVFLAIKIVQRKLGPGGREQTP